MEGRAAEWWGRTGKGWGKIGKGGGGLGKGGEGWEKGKGWEVGISAGTFGEMQGMSEGKPVYSGMEGFGGGGGG